MKNYYFTFGQAHVTKDGHPMQHNWVRVIAEDYNSAQDLFIQQFTKQRMEAPNKWAFQYEEEKFRPEFFPCGEYELIEQSI